MLGIGDRDAEQHGAEDRDAQRGERRPEAERCGQPAERDDELDQRDTATRSAGRNRGTSRAARSQLTIGMFSYHAIGRRTSDSASAA